MAGKKTADPGDDLAKRLTALAGESEIDEATMVQTVRVYTAWLEAQPDPLTRAIGIDEAKAATLDALYSASYDWADERE